MYELENEAGEQLRDRTECPEGWQAEHESGVSWQPGPAMPWGARQGRALTCSDLGWPHFQCWGQHKIRKIISFRQSSKEAMRIVKGLEEKPYGEQLR